MTFQGYEPEIFKSAFNEWHAFNRQGIDDDELVISEESDSNSEDSDKDGDAEGTSTDAATVVSGDLRAEDLTQNRLNEDQKKKISAYISESFWINF